MTAKQKRFIEEYLIDLNATQAAIRAGYRPKAARQMAAENLTKPDIAEAIQKAQQRRSVRTEITQDRILKEVARIAFFDPRKVMEWGPRGVTFRESNELTDDEAACVVEASQTVTESGGTIRVKLADKIAGLTLAGKHLGMFRDQIAVDLIDQVEVTVKIVDPQDTQNAAPGSDALPPTG